MKTLLIVILVIVAFFYVLSLFGRVMLRLLISNKQKEFERAFNQQAGSRSNPGRPRREGEISVDTGGAPRRKPIDKSVGDYVDYEEIK